MVSALSALGFFSTIEFLYMSVYLIVSAVGIILNIISVVVFYRPAFYSPTAPPLFSYMRYEAMIGIIGNLAAIVFGLNSCTDILPFANTDPSLWIDSFIALPIHYLTFYAKFLIEIVIVLDRIMMLLPSLGSRYGLNNLLKVKRPYLVLIGICIFSILVNFPYFYLVSVPTLVTLVNYGYPRYKVNNYLILGRTAWSSWSGDGYYYMIGIYVFKNFLTFIVETLLNITSLVLFKRHLARKVRLQAPRLDTIIQTQGGGQTMPSGKTRRSMSREAGTGGRHMADFVLVMSVTGFATNMMQLFYTLYFTANPKPTLIMRLLQFIAFFASTFRHAINFVLFYAYNVNFRKETKIVLIKLKLTNNVVSV
jgi:hypothetical protein